MTGPRPPAPPAQFTTQLLVDLAMNPLDAGYAAAADRRGPNPPRRWYDRPAVVVGCLLIGFVLVLAYDQTHRSAPEAAKVHDSLVARVRTAQTQGTALAAQAQQLNSQLTTLRDRALSGGSLGRQLDREQLLAGQTAVTGPGIEVVLTDAPVSTASAQPGRAGSTPIGATNTLSDRDVRSVVNQLWSDGAEAISVNGVRLTPTSAIRFAGQAVLVDFQPITSPYTIRAIGDENDLITGFAASDVASRYQTLAGAEGIGFRFSEQSTLDLAAGAAVTPRYAHPAVPTPTPAPSPTGSHR